MEASALPAASVAHGRAGALRRIARDERLVELVRRGHVDAFDAIYDRYNRQLLSFCRHMLGSREEAEDAVQHTFMAAYTDLGRSDKPINLRPWLYTIARNHCYSVLRSRREQTALEDAEPSVDGLASEVQRRQDLRDLLRDLAGLPYDQRAALVLAELGSLSHEEIAEIVDCPKAKVKALVFQARSSLAASREARETPCHEIREQLAVLSGGSLRRTTLRRHLRECPGCREFQDEVKRQRRAMAVLLPVVPTAGMKAGVLGPIAAKAGGAGGAGIAAAGAAGGGGAATAGGAGAILANAGAAKLAIAAVVAAAGIGGSVAAVKTVEDGSSATTSPGVVTPSSRDAATRAGDALATPSGVVPTRAHGEHAPGRLSGGVANGKNPKGDHGRSATAPGHAGTSPGRLGTAPGKARTTPGHVKHVQRTLRGHGKTVPRRARGAPSRSGSGNGRSGSSPGHSGTQPSRSGSGAGTGSGADTRTAPSLPAGSGTAGAEDLRVPTVK